MARDITILGVESTCDETAAAIVRAAPSDGAAGDVAHGDVTAGGVTASGGVTAPGEILSSIVWGQASLHARFGGVVPEIAARAHVERLDLAIAAALDDAGVGLDDVDAIAVASGPGLIGGVLAGVATAKAIAAARSLPLLGINHLEGHALSPRLSDGVAYPYPLLLASGGHCQLLDVQALGRYRRLGGTIDDSPGEAFDKIAKHLGLGFPGGPQVEARARSGDPNRFALPRPLLDRSGADMSFSGLKTATRVAADALVRDQRGLYERDIDDLCASFQAAVCETLAEKTRRALAAVETGRPSPDPALAVAGGVAANAALRTALGAVAAETGRRLVAPPLSLCTDNAAMIAWAGAERLAAGERHAPDAVSAKARWPLDQTADALLGGGKRGAKA